MCMGILLQIACVNITPRMIKDDEQYIDMLSSSERTIVFTTNFSYNKWEIKSEIK